VPSQEAIYGFEGAYAIRLVVESVRTLVKVHKLESILCRCPARLGTKVGVLLESDFLSIAAICPNADDGTSACAGWSAPNNKAAKPR
jgi:hypothetical protein